MKLTDFDYILPEELIAQYPLKERDKCRLEVLNRADNSISHKAFEDITGYFKKGDCLVLNDTKVIPARLFGKRKTGGKVELFMLGMKPCSSGVTPPGRWDYEALVRPSGRLKEGERITLESGDEAEVLDRGEAGRRVKFERPLEDIMKSIGHVPLPPYITRADEDSDKKDYQTVYGNKEGATASPTAGLHFTKELLGRVSGSGVRVSFVTLHTNYGTFAPVKTRDVESHKMHREYYELPQETIQDIRETKKSGGKVFAVGTTSTRVLEYCAEKITNDACEPAASPRGEPARHEQRTTPNHSLRSGSGHANDEQRTTNNERRMTSDEQRTTNDERGYTSLYIYPGYKFKIIDHLITNFHLPKSTLLLLVSAFAGKEFVFEAYRRAIEKRYRFFSYGDAMLIL